MSLLDFNMRLTPTAQAVTTTAVTTDAYPLVQAGRDIGIGEPMCLMFTITVAALVAGTETYAFQAVTATASDGTTGQRILAEVPFTTAQAAALTAGAKVVVPIPPGMIPATATHLAGRLETANSAGTTILCDFMPLRLTEHIKAYVGKPAFAA